MNELERLTIKYGICCMDYAVCLDESKKHNEDRVLQAKQALLDYINQNCKCNEGTQAEEQ